MAKWAPHPHPDPAFRCTPATLKKRWARLHRGDCEPLPTQAGAVQAWIAYHAGDFEAAVQLGLAAGDAGLNAANKAAIIHAHYLEASEPRRLARLQEAAERAAELQSNAPDNANAYYLYAMAMGRYSQGISVTRALAQGLGAKVRDALRQALALQPAHADAHIAMGTWHAEVIDKVGALIAGLTYGARREAALEHFGRALALNPDSAIARIEYANALVMLDGKRALKQAEGLYAEAAACTPADAMEWLDVELARKEIG